MAFLESILLFLEEGYLTLLAYMFILFIEYLIFTLAFKHEKDPVHGDVVKLRYWGDDGHFVKAKIVMLNLAIVLVLIPFVLIPLKNIMKYALLKTGAYIIPLTFLAGALGYLAATKEHINHHWENEDTTILVSGLSLFLLGVFVIIRLGI